MTGLPKYIINGNTSAISSYYVNETEYSKIYEGNKTLIVWRKPQEVVDDSFKHIGVSLEQIVNRTRAILKMKYKIPLAFSALQNIILIRLITTTDHIHTTYLINSHIRRLQKIESNQTLVFLTGGQALAVKTKIELIKEKQVRADLLRNSLMENAQINRTLILHYESGKGITLVKEVRKISYYFKQNNTE
nr:competence protein ComK [uncultured Bacillus sp.]